MSNYHEIKEECYEANLLLPEQKLIDLTFGNVSVADQSRGVFAIKPSGVGYRVMQSNDMVKKAVENAFALEIVAEMAMKTIQLNPQVQAISTRLLDKHFFRKHGTDAYYGQG